jgi:hypothetical protein
MAVRARTRVKELIRVSYRKYYRDHHSISFVMWSIFWVDLPFAIWDVISAPSIDLAMRSGARKEPFRRTGNDTDSCKLPPINHELFCQ